MFHFIVRRLLQMAILLPILSVVIFYIISLMPNPLDEKMASNPKMTIRDKKRLAKQFNLDKPAILNLSVKDLEKNVEAHLKHLIPPSPVDTFPYAKELQNLEEKTDLSSAEAKRYQILQEEQGQHNQQLQKYANEKNNHDLALEELRNWGGVCVPVLMKIKKDWQEKIDHYSSSNQEPSPYIEQMLALNKLLRELASTTPNGDWISWYETYKTEYDPITLRTTTAQLKLEISRPQAVERILRVGTPYIEFLIVELKRNTLISNPHLFLILNLLSILTSDIKERDSVEKRQESFERVQKGQTLRGSRYFREEDREEACKYWKDWWRQNDSDYRSLSNSDIFIRTFTQTQYGVWLGRIVNSFWKNLWDLNFNFLSLDFGNSHVYKEPVVTRLKHTLINTLWLTLMAFSLSMIIALPLGIISAAYQYRKIDYAINAFAFVGMSVPTFFSGLLSIYLFAFYFGWFPSGGMVSPKIASMNSWVDFARHLVLPVCILAYYEIAMLIRYTRTSLLEVIGQDYVRTARAKGLDEDMVIFKHALRNALIPVITVLATSMPFLFSGALVTETIFSWEGMGSLLYEAIKQKDSNVEMPSFMFLAFLTMLFNLIADVLYAVVDPRIQHS